MIEDAFGGPIFNVSVDLLSSTSDDGDNVTKFSSNQLASFNFDGFIPTITESIFASELRPGMRFSLDGDPFLYQILEVAGPDEDFEEEAIQEYTVFYNDQNRNAQEFTLLPDDLLTVTYEEWDEKIIGNNGWLITSEGNAIFSNVAVRGRIEAQEGFLENLDITGQLNVSSDGSIRIGEDPGVSSGIIIDEFGFYSYNEFGDTTFSIDSATGDVSITGDIEATTLNVGGADGITYDGEIVTIGSDVNILGGLTIGEVEDYLNEEGYTTEDDLAGYVEFPDLASYATYAALSGNGTTTINGGNVSTGIIDSTTYLGTGDPVNGTAFSSEGMAINLTTGAMISPNFRISSAGDAEFRGTITAGRGTFTGATSSTVDGLTRVRYNPSGFWQTAETPTLEITKNAGLNSTGYLSIYRPASTSSNTAVGIALFSQGGSGDGDSSSEAVMRAGIEYGASTADGFESGGLLRIIAMPSKSNITPGKVKVQAAGSNTKIQMSSTNFVLTNSKDGQYNPGIQVVDAASTAMLGIRTTDGVVSLGPRISYGTNDASTATSGWSPGAKNGDLHFQF